jgi:hypothetical protein
MTTITTSVSARLFALATLLTLGTSLALAQQPSPAPSDDGPDPALANMAPADAAAMSAQQQNPGQPDTSSENQAYPQQEPAPIVREAPQPAAALSATDAYNAPQPAAEDEASDDQANANEAAGQDAIDAANLAADQPPPPLPDYDQPPAPADDFMWTPGYWGYADVGYYWVPGVWIRPPFYGALWTPGYWGFYNAKYRFHPGYWGTHIGFYGGVNYGFGYIGVGYFGGYWNGGHFFYNRSVTHVGGNVTNVYNRTVIYNNHQYGAAPGNHISYNGGRGGINVAPRPAEVAAMHEQHIGALPGQVRLHQSAATNPQAAFSMNHGHPATAAQERPLGATRPISVAPSAFQGRPALQQQQQQRMNIQPQPRMQPQPQRQQPQIQQPRMQQPQSRPAPAAAPARGGDGKH